MHRPVSPATRLSVQRALAASVLVVAALVAVSLRGQATEHVDITAQTRAAAFAGSRPAINGASRPCSPRQRNERWSGWRRRPGA